jgi:glycosyltransferase involved in cell wall biosynthesis
LKILFVFSGNTSGTNRKTGQDIAILKNPRHQGDSLIEMGYDVDFYQITGKGFCGYIKNIPKIRRAIKKGKYDIIHAHYSYSAIAASLAGTHRMVVSLMGSDTFSSPLMLMIIRLFCLFRWKRIIVKTDAMAAKIRSRKVTVLPNGVNMDLFRPIDRSEARKALSLPDKKIVLFPADPARPEKNFKLASDAFNRLGREDTILLPVHDVPHHLIPYYMNSADVLLLTSLWEGSVNAVKEALACNLKVVSTDVGDVRRNIAGLSGCYITSSDADDIAEKLNEALDNKIRTRGAERILEMGLDSASINKRLTALYSSVI